jgi:GH24 family phage-related lysozyme (muramidase)
MTRYNNTRGNFTLLPDQAQTVLFDIGYQLDPNGIPQNIMQEINNGNYSGAADLMQNMNQGPANRRNAEADLLRQVPNTNETNRRMEEL